MLFPRKAARQWTGPYQTSVQNLAQQIQELLCNHIFGLGHFLKPHPVVFVCADSH